MPKSKKKQGLSKFVNLILLAAFINSAVTTDISFAFSPSNNKLAPNSAIKLLDEYKEELELLSRNTTPTNIRDSQKLRKIWESKYRGANRSFEEFIRAANFEDGWVADIAGLFVKNLISRIDLDPKLKAEISREAERKECIDQIAEWARKSDVPRYRKEKLIAAVNGLFKDLITSAGNDIDNELLVLANQKQFILKPYQITTYVETRVLSRIADYLYGKHKTSGNIQNTDIEYIVGAEIARYSAYLDANRETIKKIYGTRKDDSSAADRKIASAESNFNGTLHKVIARLNINPQKDEASPDLVYFDFSDEARILRAYPSGQKDAQYTKVIRQYSEPSSITYSRGLSYKKFKLAGLLNRRGGVHINSNIPNPEATARHEVTGHVNTAYLLATAPALFEKIVDSFNKLPDPHKEDILKEFFRIRVNPSYKKQKHIPDTVIDRLELPKLTELLSKAREWRQDTKDSKGRTTSVINMVRVIDELIGLWAEFSYSLDNIIDPDLKRPARHLHTLLNLWIDDNNAMFKKAGYFDSLTKTLAKDVSGISDIAWCWGWRLGELVDKKNSRDRTELDSKEGYAYVREADEAFARGFIDKVEKEGLGDLDTSDKDGLAGQLSDDIVEDVIFNEIVPQVNMQVDDGGKDEIDIDGLTKRVAQQLRDRLFGGNEKISIDDILTILNSPDMREKLTELKKRIEKYTVYKTNPSISAPVQDTGATDKDKQVAKRAATDAAVKRRQADTSSSSRAPRGGMTSPAPADTGDKSELPSYLSDLTQKAADGDIDEIYFRDGETRDIKRIVNRKESANVMLLGDAGVGKTALVNKLALEIARKEAGYGLDNYKILLLDPAAFIASSGGTADGFGALVTQLIERISDNRTILFIDEIHLFSDRRGIPGVTSNFFQLLKTSLASGKIKIIGATTTDEFKLDIENDTALCSRFSMIDVKPPSPSQAKDILIAMKARYEKAQNKDETDESKHISISDDACLAAVDISERVLRTKPLLRKATKALDEAAVAVRTRPDEIQDKIKSAKRNISFLANQLRKARQSNNAKRIDEISSSIRRETRKLVEAERRKEEGFSYIVSIQDALEAFAKFGIPMNVLNETEKDKVDGLEPYLNSNLKGQGEAIDTIVSAVKRQYVNQNRKKPIGSFFFAGPTGTGKTEIARLLAKYLFDSEDPEKDGTLIRVDLSQYKEPHRISELLGAPPGYVGFGTGKTFLDYVKEKPYSVILFDEADKCHPSILSSIFLPIMEDGTLKTPSGEIVDFANTIIIFTSNLGLEAKDYSMGPEKLKTVIKEAMTKYMPPEFLNRMEEPVVFNLLSREVVSSIIKDVQLPQLVRRYQTENRITIELEAIDSIVDLILEKGFNDLEGARGVKKAIEELIDNVISDMLLSGAITERNTVIIKRAMGEDGSPLDRLDFDIKNGEIHRASNLATKGNPEELRILNKIEEIISERDLAEGDIDAILDIKPQDMKSTYNFKPRETINLKEAPKISIILDEFTPGKKDPVLDDAVTVEKLKTLALDSGYELNDGDAAKINMTVRRLANEAKRQTRDILTRLITKAAKYSDIKSGDKYSSERKQILEAAAKTRQVSIAVTLEDGRLVAKINYPTYLTLENEESLIKNFGHENTDKAQVDKTPKDDRPLAEARLDILSLKGICGYEKEAGQKTNIWFVVNLSANPAAPELTPVPKKPAAADKPTARESKTSQVLKPLTPSALSVAPIISRVMRGINIISENENFASLLAGIDKSETILFGTRGTFFMPFSTQVHYSPDGSIRGVLITEKGNNILQYIPVSFNEKGRMLFHRDKAVLYKVPREAHDGCSSAVSSQILYSPDGSMFGVLIATDENYKPLYVPVSFDEEGKIIFHDDKAVPLNIALRTQYLCSRPESTPILYSPDGSIKGVFVMDAEQYSLQYIPISIDQKNDILFHTDKAVLFGIEGQGKGEFYGSSSVQILYLPKNFGCLS